jgi:hypothetical protein
MLFVIDIIDHTADVEDNGVEPLPDGITQAGMTFPTAVGTL